MFNPVNLQQLPTNLYQLCQILQQASQILQKQYALYCQGGDFTVQQKQDESPVTQADLLVNQFLVQQLNALDVVYPILSEEGQHEERKHWQEFWMIDPLDGTKEFIKKTGEFTINLSLIREGELVVSALAVPLKNTIYINQQNNLPYRYIWSENQVDLSQYADQRVNGYVENDRILNIAMSRRPQQSGYKIFLDNLDQAKINYHKVVAGSAYKFCMMLEGEIDIYPRLHPTSEWDTAAGQGLLQGIGGEVFTISGKPFVYNQRNTLENGSFFAVCNVDDWAYFKKFLP